MPRNLSVSPDILQLIERKVKEQINLIIRNLRRQRGVTERQEGYADLVLPDADYQLADTEWVNKVIEISGVWTSGHALYFPPLAGAIWIVRNFTAQSVNCATLIGTGVNIATSRVAIIYCDGTNIVRASADSI